MMYFNYPQLVSVPEEVGLDNVALLIHRNVPCEHLDSADCPCRPWGYAAHELGTAESLTMLNARLHQELQ